MLEKGVLGSLWLLLFCCSGIEGGAQKRCHILFQGHSSNFKVKKPKNYNLASILAFKITRPVTAIKSLRFALFSNKFQMKISAELRILCVLYCMLVSNSHIWQSLSLRDWRWKAAVTLGWMGATFSGSDFWPPWGTAIAIRPMRI